VKKPFNLQIEPVLVTFTHLTKEELNELIDFGKMPRSKKWKIIDELVNTSLIPLIKSKIDWSGNFVNVSCVFLTKTEPNLQIKFRQHPHLFDLHRKISIWREDHSVPGEFRVAYDLHPFWPQKRINHLNLPPSVASYQKPDHVVIANYNPDELICLACPRFLSKVEDGYYFEETTIIWLDEVIIPPNAPYFNTGNNWTFCPKIDTSLKQMDYSWLLQKLRLPKIK